MKEIRKNSRKDKEWKVPENTDRLTWTEPCLSAGVNVPPAPDCFTASGHVAPTPFTPPPPTPPPAASWRNTSTKKLRLQRVKPYDGDIEEKFQLKIVHNPKCMCTCVRVCTCLWYDCLYRCVNVSISSFFKTFLLITILSLITLIIVRIFIKHRLRNKNRFVILHFRITNKVDIVLKYIRILLQICLMKNFK